MKQQEFLVKAFQAGNFSHAYLLSGNDEQGKEQAIQSVLQLYGCNTMTSHPDVVIVRPLEEDGKIAKEISIQQAQDLISRLSLGAWTLPLTFVLVHYAERLNQEAQSALLKILEDGTQHAVFFFLTRFPLLILPTVRSRMQEARFWKFDRLSVPARAVETLQRLQNQSLHERFVFAKKLAESPEESYTLLDEWTLHARQLMLERLGHSAQQAKAYAAFIHALQECKRNLEHTNASPRMLLEKVMLEF